MIIWQKDWQGDMGGLPGHFLNIGGDEAGKNAPHFGNLGSTKTTAKRNRSNRLAGLTL